MKGPWMHLGQCWQWGFTVSLSRCRMCTGGLSWEYDSLIQHPGEHVSHRLPPVTLGDFELLIIFIKCGPLLIWLFTLYFSLSGRCCSPTLTLFQPSLQEHKWIQMHTTEGLLSVQSRDSSGQSLYTTGSKQGPCQAAMLHFGTPLVLSAQDSPQQPENLKLFSHEAGFVTKFSQTESYTSLLPCLLLDGARPCKVFCNKSL